MAVKGYGSKNTVGKMGWIDYVSKKLPRLMNHDRQKCNLQMAKDTKGNMILSSKRKDLAQRRDRHEPKNRQRSNVVKRQRTGKMEQVPVRSKTLLTSMDQT